MTTLTAPFSYFGGKSTVADEVWRRFGDVPNYIEPFAGSLAVLLARPHEPHTETVNDLDGYITNVWRAIAAAPDEVARYADWPVNENDLFARHVWLVQQKQTLIERLMADPDYYDAKIAGWWVWGASSWIGSGWCSGNGGWAVENGEIVRRPGVGVTRKRPHLANTGRGVHCVKVVRQLPRLSDAGVGVHRATVDSNGLYDWMRALSARLRRVRVACGDWSRIVKPAVLQAATPTGVFLDPPYGAEDRDPRVYNHDSLTVAADVRRWCIENGDNPNLRIALCGYVGEGHDDLVEHGWTLYRWKTNGGYSNNNRDRDNQNKHREAIWFSPHCLRPGGLWDSVD